MNYPTKTVPITSRSTLAIFYRPTVYRLGCLGSHGGRLVRKYSDGLGRA